MGRSYEVDSTSSDGTNKRQRHLGVHLGTKVVGPRVERPVRYSRLIRKVEGRADAEVGSSAAIDEVVHHPRGAIADDVFPIIFKVVRIAGMAMLTLWAAGSR
jgi:hypothetical protein